MKWKKDFMPFLNRHHYFSTGVSAFCLTLRCTLWGQIKPKIRCILIHISECINLLYDLSLAILNLSCVLIVYHKIEFLTMRQQTKARANKAGIFITVRTNLITTHFQLLFNMKQSERQEARSPCSRTHVLLLKSIEYRVFS